MMIKNVSACYVYDDFDGLLVTIETPRLAKFYHQGNLARLGFIKVSLILALSGGTIVPKTKR